MRYPKLVPAFVCRIPISVTLYGEGLTEKGEPLAELTLTLKCCYQDKAKTVLTDKKKLVEISGTALFDGDIAPDMPVISGGTAEIFGVRRRIAVGSKGRNPDGTVNYTALELV